MTPAEWTYFSPLCKFTFRMDFFYASIYTYQDLIEEVLDELLLERSGSEETVEIGSKQLGDKVAT
jgi:hypothetical protein